MTTLSGPSLRVGMGVPSPLTRISEQPATTEVGLVRRFNHRVVTRTGSARCQMGRAVACYISASLVAESATAVLTALHRLQDFNTQRAQGTVLFLAGLLLLSFLSFLAVYSTFERLAAPLALTFVFDIHFDGTKEGREGGMDVLNGINVRWF